MTEERLKGMGTDELKAELARLKAGQVGIGFDREHLTQCMGMVACELKRKAPPPKLPHEAGYRKKDDVV